MGDVVTSGSPVTNPYRVHKPVATRARRPMRRGAFRVDETERVVTVLRIDHRADAYRPR